MTPDGGSNWYNYSGSLPNVPINCIVYQNGTNEGLYVGTDLGVYYTDGSMADWIPYQAGLPNVVVTELEISYNDNKLWAATFGRGLWQSEVNSTAVSVANNNSTAEADINIYPNPNNGQFIVQLPSHSSGIVEVYNANGQLCFSEKTFGTESLHIQLDHQVSGMYLVRATCDDRLITKKLLVEN